MPLFNQDPLPNPLRAKELRDGSSIVPLDGGLHLHLHRDGGFHLTENLLENAKNRYRVTGDGDLQGPNLL